MRVLRISIREWRNLKDVDIDVPDDARLVCLVGENGTGKSSILELLSSIAHHLGIAHGTALSRGNPLGEAQELSVTVRVSTRDLPRTMQMNDGPDPSWSGELLLTSSVGGNPLVTAVGIEPEARSTMIAQNAISELREVHETQHLFLDADRAYPPTGFNPQQFSEIWNQDFRDPVLNRQLSARPSRTLYEEWIKYLVGVEERTGAQLIADTRNARAMGAPDSVFVDPFDDYRILLNKTLPHLRFVGVESSGANRTVQFDSSGLNMVFSQLSGGEREIAFLTGQIDRFKLQHGLLLVDEPELHLNPDLLRTWLAFLRDTISDGQVWFATHSLEAVEVAGPEATFVFERETATRVVRNPRVLAGRPVLSALSAAIGSPAFSIARLRFVLIEGDRQTRERERFYSVCGDTDLNRFLECGGCSEVLRKIGVISELARETEEQLRVGGVIDRDFRRPSDVRQLEVDHGVHVLRCHEIENVFLHPPSIDFLLTRAGLGGTTGESLVLEESDKYAGLWIFDYACTLHSVTVPREAKQPIAGAGRSQITAQWLSLRADSASFVDAAEKAEWEANLDAAMNEFEALRLNPNWWMHCLGKQTLSGLSRPIGISSSQVLEHQVVGLWDREVATPRPVVDLRAYLNDLS